MEFLLSLLLAMVIFVATCIVLVVLLYKFKIKRNYLYHLAASLNKFPGRLRLKQQESVSWQKKERAQARIAEFEAAGFTSLGGFAIDELPNARLLVLQNPATGMLGVVNETAELGTWSDVLLFSAGEIQPVLASSICKPALLRFLPGDPKIHKPDATVPELVRAVQSAAGNSPASRFTADEFARRFEQVFAEATDARLLSPLDDRELRQLLKEHGRICGGELSEKEFSVVKQLLPLAIENELRLVCGSQFVRETSLPATEWQHAAERLLVIHDRTTIRRLAGKLIYGVFLTREMKRHLRKTKPTGEPCADFAKFNETLPAWVRYKKLGEVSRPVKADIYRATIEREK
jgi:hypothetical protein